MSDRWVFLTGFLSAVLIVAAAFELPQFFLFELAKSAVFFAIAVLVFFGEGRFGYMLGIVFPALWFLSDIAVGVFFRDFRVLLDYLVRKGIGPLDTPLNAVARIVAVLLLIASVRAWRKTVPEKFLGKTLRTCMAISLIYATGLAWWYFHLFPLGGAASGR